jgi:hypothetical protein
MSGRGGIKRTSWQRRVAVWMGLAIALVVVWLIGAAIIPRWWAHRVTDVTDGRLVVGGLYGFFTGFVFTVLPLLALWIALRARRGRRSWKWWVGWIVIAAILALPNLMTLGIVLGGGDAARDGRAELNTDGNGFRMWSLIGAIVGALAVLLLVYLVRSRGWFRDESRRLRDEATSRDAP